MKNYIFEKKKKVPALLITQLVKNMPTMQETWV